MPHLIGGPGDGASVHWDADEVAARIPGSAHLAHYRRQPNGDYLFLAIYAAEELQPVEEHRWENEGGKPVEP